MRRHVDYLLGIPFLKGAALVMGSRSQVRREAKKILFIKLAAMGDTVLLIPVFRQMKKANPKLEIHWMVSKTNVEVARLVPYVDRLWVWDPITAASLWRWSQSLKKENFDAVVDAEQWARGTALLTRLIDAPVRIGFDTPGQHRKAAYTHPVAKRSDRHEIKEFFGLIEPLLGNIYQEQLELWETEHGQQELGRALSNYSIPPKAPWIVLHPGCGSDGLPREWPLENYSVLGHWLMRQYGATLILTSGPEEKIKTQNLNKLLGHQAVDLGGAFGWQALISLLKQSALVISGNTGVMHVAAALGRPQVALHGPTNPVLWGPINEKSTVVSSPCPQCPCLVLGYEYHNLTQSCMAQISMDTVKKAVFSRFDNKRDI